MHMLAKTFWFRVTVVFVSYLWTLILSRSVETQKQKQNKQKKKEWGHLDLMFGYIIDRIECRNDLQAERTSREPYEHAVLYASYDLDSQSILPLNSNSHSDLQQNNFGRRHNVLWEIVSGPI